MALFTEVVNLHPYDYYGQESADVWETISENVTWGFEQNGVYFEVELCGCTCRDRMKNQLSYFCTDNAKNLKKFIHIDNRIDTCSIFYLFAVVHFIYL